MVTLMAVTDWIFKNVDILLHIILQCNFDILPPERWSPCSHSGSCGYGRHSGMPHLRPGPKTFSYFFIFSWGSEHPHKQLNWGHCAIKKHKVGPTRRRCDNRNGGSYLEHLWVPGQSGVHSEFQDIERPCLRKQRMCGEPLRLSREIMPAILQPTHL